VSIPTVSPEMLKELAEAGRLIDLIDVRTPAEYRELHVALARNVPLDRLDPAELARSRRPGEPLYVICQSGTRGRLACGRLLAAGCPDVVNVEGGTVACAAAGLPVVRGRKAVSLERQVRIAAGLLVVLGAVLGWVAHPALAGLSAFVGAGLVFAGVTDTCGMGMLLARMPWNRGGQTAACTTD
jgi:rhodanese-related sulfurtransferase